MVKRVLFVFLMLLLAACSSATLKESPPGPTPPLPELNQVLEGDRLDAFTTMLAIRAHAKVLNELGRLVDKGELSDCERANWALRIASLSQQVEVELNSFEPPEEVRIQWDAAVRAHDRTRELLVQWGSKQIDTHKVLLEVEDFVADTEEIIVETEELLAEGSIAKREALAAHRDDALKEILVALHSDQPSWEEFCSRP